MAVTRVILPKLGLTMEEGKLVAWRKREGETVAQGEVLFEVETDKATIEVESPAAGILRKVLVQPGDSVPVTETIALISTSADEPLPEVTRARAPAAEVATRSAVAPAPAISTGDGDRVRASPAARRRAEELGVDVNAVSGTGPGGRITLEDVERAATSAPAGEKHAPLSRMRRAIAERMTRSARDAPQFSISRDVDMTTANDARKRAGVSYTDVIVAACAKTLRAHRAMRSRVDGDALVTSEGIHVGIAVALDDGLLVPVIRNADAKDLPTLARERAALEQGAQSGKLPADALTGAVFTVSNLGTQGVDRFTAIVNPPEAAILAVGRVVDRVVARDGAPAIRPVVSLTLSVDHRVADGATAARFLSDVADRLERGDL